MKCQQTAISGLLLLTLDVYSDERGIFFEGYQGKRFEEMGIPPFVQDNFSISKDGVIRALHYQVPPMAQGKLVQVLSGKVLDVAVDIRHGSPTFGKHVAVELSAENHQQLWIPAGFAHGFASLTEGTIFQYKCTGYYSAEHERGIRYDDSTLGIDWRVEKPILNKRDLEHPLLSDIPKDFIFEG
ncbi:MAG: dTDP-4-dehydrorhamnose 3,5-epimerase [Candidatus Moraniibacteriota bacterium]